MRGKSDLETSKQKISPSTSPSRAPSRIVTLLPLGLTKTFPSRAGKSPQSFRQSYATLHLHGSAAFCFRSSCTCQHSPSFYPICTKTVPSYHFLRMLPFPVILYTTTGEFGRHIKHCVLYRSSLILQVATALFSADLPFSQ